MSSLSVSRLSTTRLSAWLDELGRSTAIAEKAEQDFRAEFARRVAALADERAVAYRRANLVRAIAEAIAEVEDERAAIAHGLAVLRTRLGWSSDSEARTEILSRFAPICAAAFLAIDPPQVARSDSPSAAGQASAARPAGRSEDNRTPSPDLRADPSSPEDGEPAPPNPATALASFESWYVSARGTSFWLLFENVMPETPLVDF